MVALNTNKVGQSGYIGNFVTNQKTAFCVSQLKLLKLWADIGQTADAKYFIWVWMKIIQLISGTEWLNLYFCTDGMEWSFSSGQNIILMNVGCENSES